MQLLTRAGCTRTALMHSRLSSALATLGLTVDVEMVDLDALPSGDERRGYGTPTILVTGRDLFDMPAPVRHQAPAT